MYRTNNHRHRRPDFLTVLVTLVGIAMGATLALQYHALSSDDTGQRPALLSSSPSDS